MLKTLQEIVKAAQKNDPAVIAVAVAQDEVILQAVAAAAKEKIVVPILVGDKKEILRIASENKIDLSNAEIIDEQEKAAACMIAASQIKQGKANILMKGHVDTSLVMKAVLSKDNDLKKTNLISHIAVMEVHGYDRLIYVTDAAMNIAPDLNDKAEIIKNAVEVAHALGNENPKIAVLCAVEKVNSKMPCTEDAQKLTQMNRDGTITGCIVSGPLALDNAVSVDAAQHKGIDDPVAGHADILVTPDIEAGNMLNKAMEYFAGAEKAGVMMGAKAPIVLVSRASSAQSKMFSIALGALIANTQREAQ